jgi:hypothetical protein
LISSPHQETSYKKKQKGIGVFFWKMVRSHLCPLQCTGVGGEVIIGSNEKSFLFLFLF